MDKYIVWKTKRCCDSYIFPEEYNSEEEVIKESIKIANKEKHDFYVLETYPNTDLPSIEKLRIHPHFIDQKGYYNYTDVLDYSDWTHSSFLYSNQVGSYPEKEPHYSSTVFENIEYIIETVSGSSWPVPKYSELDAFQEALICANSSKKDVFIVRHDRKENSFEKIIKIEYHYIDEDSLYHPTVVQNIKTGDIFTVKHCTQVYAENVI